MSALQIILAIALLAIVAYDLMRTWKEATR